MDWNLYLLYIFRFGSKRYLLEFKFDFVKKAWGQSKNIIVQSKLCKECDSSIKTMCKECNSLIKNYAVKNVIV